MKYQEFRTTIKEEERSVLDLVFSFSKEFYEDKFELCFALAEELAKVNEQDLGMIIKFLDKMPSKYLSASLAIMNIVNKQNINISRKIKDEVLKIYVEDFKKAISKKKCRFAFFDKSSIEDYLSLKTRLVDEVEIIKIAKALNIKVDYIIGEYKGENKETEVLNKARSRICENSVKAEYKPTIEKVIISSLEDAIKNIQELNKSNQV